MNRNTDVVAQGLAAIAPFKLFIAARRQDVEDEAAKMHSKASVAPGAPFGGSGSSTPLSVVASTEEEEADGAEEAARTAVPRATDSAPTGEPGVQATTETATTPTLPQRETVPPTTKTTRLATQETAPQAGLSEGSPAPERVSVTDASEATVLSYLATPEEAMVQFEASWHLSESGRLPRVVQQAFVQRDREPDAFAQKMIGASLEGFLPEALEAAVATLIRVDPYFQAADLLSRKPGYSQLFKIELDAEDYGASDNPLQDEDECAEDRTLSGEADRAAERGD